MIATNRLVEYLLGVVTNIFEDVRYMYPSAAEWNRDKTRLLLQLKARGPSLLILEFPPLAKHLNQCLDQGTYTNPHGALCASMRKGIEIPRFLRQIYLRIFDHNGEMVPTPCENAVLFLKTLFSTWKAIKLPSTKEVIENEVSNFFSRDACLPSPTLDWAGVDLDPDNVMERLTLRESFPDLDLREERTLQGVFSFVASGLGLPPHLCEEDSEVRLVPRHGRGVVANLPKGQSKYRFPYWPDKLQRSFPYDLFALPNPGWAIDVIESDSFVDKTTPSRLIAVPKTIDRPRLIAAEPTENQWIQQLLWGSLREKIHTGALQHSVCFNSQEPNQVLALEGSRSGKYATMDLSEASDRLSCALVERFFKQNSAWLEALHACRTHECSYRIDSFDSLKRPLKKFSTMGSTVIFPLQSMMFASIAIASYLLDRNQVVNSRNIKRASLNVRVFGDDIIVLTQHQGTTRRLLEKLQLKVNLAKTFTGKNFRESCGVEAFRGSNVTPPKLLTVPTGRPGQVSSLVETSNNWYKSGYWNVANYILGQCGDLSRFLPIGVCSEQPYQVLSYCGSKVSHLKKRFNRDLQRIERQMLTSTVKSVKDEIPEHQRLLQYFTDRPDPHTKWESGTSSSHHAVMRVGWIATYS